MKLSKKTLSDGFLLSDCSPRNISQTAKTRAIIKVSRSVLSLLAVMFLASSLLLTGLPTTGRSGGTAIAKDKPQDKKFSGDLQDKMDSNTDKHIRVIVDTAPQAGVASSNAFRRIGDLGGMITRSLNGGNTAAVEIPA